MTSDNMTSNEPSAGVCETVDRVAQSAHEAIDRAASKATPALEQLQSAATNAVHTAQDKATAFGEMEEIWLESARTCVREHPLATVAVALAAGMLISRLSH